MRRAAQETSRLRDKTSHIPLLDRMAVGLSGLCVTHCVLSIVFVATLSSAGAFFTDPVIHRAGLAIALVLGLIALGQGYAAHRAVRPALVGGLGIALMALGLIVPHGLAEVAATIAGVSLLALGHLLNARARC